MESGSHEQRLAWRQEEIADTISRGYEYGVGKPTIVSQVMDLGYSREIAIQIVDSFEVALSQESATAEGKSRAKKDFRWGLLILLASGRCHNTSNNLGSRVGRNIFSDNRRLRNRWPFPPQRPIPMVFEWALISSTTERVSEASRRPGK